MENCDINKVVEKISELSISEEINNTNLSSTQNHVPTQENQQQLGNKRKNKSKRLKELAKKQNQPIEKADIEVKKETEKNVPRPEARTSDKKHFNATQTSNEAAGYSQSIKVKKEKEEYAQCSGTLDQSHSNSTQIIKIKKETAKCFNSSGAGTLDQSHFNATQISNEAAGWPRGSSQSKGRGRARRNHKSDPIVGKQTTLDSFVTAQSGAKKSSLYDVEQFANHEEAEDVKTEQMQTDGRNVAVNGKVNAESQERKYTDETNDENKSRQMPNGLESDHDTVSTSKELDAKDHTTPKKGNRDNDSMKSREESRNNQQQSDQKAKAVRNQKNKNSSSEFNEQGENRHETASTSTERDVKDLTTPEPRKNHDVSKNRQQHQKDKKPKDFNNQKTEFNNWRANDRNEEYGAYGGKQREDQKYPPKNFNKGRQDKGEFRQQQPWKGGPRQPPVPVPIRKHNELPEFIEEIKGDLFQCDEDSAMAHCVAEDLRMGAGIAVQFKESFGKVGQLRSQNKQTGEVAFIKEELAHVYYLITKKESTGKPTYQTLESSLIELKDLMIKHGEKKLAIPRLGSGLDRLDWDNVLDMIIKIFKDADIKIMVYVYNPPGKNRK